MKALLLFAVVVLATWADCQGQLASKCRPNEFYKPFDDSCMACDPYCASPCEDKIGCTKCVSGYYTSRQDPEWPNACKKCTIPNCLECRSDIYDAWPMQCIRCVDGYIQADNRRRCDLIPSGSVASGILKKPVPQPVKTVAPVPVARPTAPVYVPPHPATGPQGLPHPAGTIVMPKPVPGPVYTGPGPVVTKPLPVFPVAGPVYTGPEAVVTKPLPVFPGPGGVYTGPGPVEPKPVEQRPPTTVVLPPGYTVPRPVGTKPITPPTYLPHKPVPVIEPVPLPQPVPVVESAKPQPEVSPETLTPGTCPVGSFVKKMDGSCMECDVNCLPGQCGDNFGCAKCADGYFTRAADPEWPFVCVLCDLPNCVKCIDNAFDAWPTLCAECAPGYELSTSRKCVPASA